MTSKPLELFWIAGSPFSGRVMLTLEAKQIPSTPRLLQASQGEHKYLEGRYPARPMFGRTAHETAAIWRAVSEFSSYLQPSLVRVFGPLLTGKSQEKATDMHAALPEVHAELEKLEASLAQGRWLAGTDITAADTTAYPFLKLLLRAGGNAIRAWRHGWSR
jgi:glutathione S-transferase